MDIYLNDWKRPDTVARLNGQGGFVTVLKHFEPESYTIDFTGKDGRHGTLQRSTIDEAMEIAHVYAFKVFEIEDFDVYYK